MYKKFIRGLGELIFKYKCCRNLGVRIIYSIYSITMRLYTGTFIVIKSYLKVDKSPTFFWNLYCIY